MATDDPAIHLAYQDGLIEGMRRYAFWRDGVEYVGTGGLTLEEAITRAREDMRPIIQKAKEEHEEWTD